MIFKTQLNEMALDRSDAIDRCVRLGRQFIAHFEKIYNNPHLETVHHWAKKMQSWFDEIDRIKLRGKSRSLSLPQKINWFYSCGEYYEEIFDNDTNKIEMYEDFIDELEKTKDVYHSIHVVFQSEEV